MNIFLTTRQWRELNVENEHEFVRCAFYLGYPYLYIQNRVSALCHESERQSVINTAIDMGIKASDVLVLTQPKHVTHL